MKLNKNQRTIFKIIFNGYYDYTTQNRVAPVIDNYKKKYPNIPGDEIENIGMELFKKIKDNENLNLKYFCKMLNYRIINLFHKNRRIIERECLFEEGKRGDAIRAALINPDIYFHPEPENGPVIAWKRPLTARESIYVECLEQGMSVRAIKSAFPDLYQQEQEKLKNELKKIIIIEEEELWLKRE